MQQFQKVLDDLEREAIFKDIEIISHAEGVFLGELVERYQPKNVLEIGTGIGYSTLFLASDLPPQGKIYTCEMDLEHLQIARNAVNQAGVGEKVVFIDGDAFKTIPELKTKFDMAFMDGDPEDYHRYLNLIEGKLTGEAVIIASRVGLYESYMDTYLEEVRKLGGYDSKYYHLGANGIEVSVKQ